MVSDLFARQLVGNQQASATKGGKLGLEGCSTTHVKRCEEGWNGQAPSYVP